MRVRRISSLAVLALLAGAWAQAATLEGMVPRHLPGTISHFVAVGEARLHVREAGMGPPVLFLHPLLNDSRIWAGQLRGACAGRRCIAVDLSGHGWSSLLPGEDLSLDAYADEVIGLLDALGIDEPVDVVGFSGTGIVAALVQQRAPGRFRSMTLLSVRFIDDDTIGEAAMAAGRQYRSDNARLLIAEGRDALFRRFAAYIVAPDASLAVRARYRSMLEQTAYETIVAFMLARDVSASPDLLDNLHLPVLIPVAEADPIITNERAQEQLRRLPQGRMAMVEASGRLLPLEAPDALNEVLRDFWVELDGAGTQTRLP
ncbi:MAG: alpha/beta hydrolase [Gammaproteobacteria bacterium]|nr:alpha/beta hydrolase [Gammaproteobacteria bacterium]